MIKIKKIKPPQPKKVKIIIQSGVAEVVEKPCDVLVLIKYLDQGDKQWRIN